MNRKLQEAASRICRSEHYYDLFGAIPEEDRLDTLKKAYERLARVVHPDFYQTKAEVDLATAAFKQLSILYAAAVEGASNGLYGQNPDLGVISSGGTTYRMCRQLGDGDLCATYSGVAELEDGRSLPTFYKVAVEAGDNDLLRAEAMVLQQLRSDLAASQFHPYFSELLSSFSYDDGQCQYQVNALSLLEGFCDLGQLKQQLSELDPLHMTWIWRRILYALGYVHRKNIVHGAMTPGNIMVLPEQHGVVLVDWCYASSFNDSLQAISPIKAIVSNYRDWYSPEVISRQPPSAATDIAMAARSMIWLMGGDPIGGVFADKSSVPVAMQAFLRGCIADSLYSRPYDAWTVLGEFDALLEHLGKPYFPRTFRPLVLPTGKA